MKRIFKMRIDRLKIVVPAVCCVTVIMWLCILAWWNIKYFEKTLVTQTQEHLLTIAKTQAQSIEEIFDHIHGELERLSGNPTFKELLVKGSLHDHPEDSDYSPEQDTFACLYNWPYDPVKLPG